MQTYLTSGSYTEYELTDGELSGKFVTVPDDLYYRYLNTKEEWRRIQKELEEIYK